MVIDGIVEYCIFYSLYNIIVLFFQGEQPPVYQDPVLLESEAVPPPPNELTLHQYDSYDPDSDSGVHEPSVIPSDDDGQTKSNEMTVPLDTSSPTPLRMDASPVETTRENRSSSSSVTSIINTSSDSLVHHGAIMSYNNQDSTSSELPHASFTQQSIQSHIEKQTALSHDSTHRVDQGPPKGDKVNLVGHNKREKYPEMAGEVYSSVVSPQMSQRSLSPLNTLSLKQEMQLTEEGETSTNQELSSTGDKRTLSMDSTPIDSQALSSSDEGKMSTITASHDIDDRSLEQFSEILLDSDISLSDSETQNTHDKNGRPTETKKCTKKVRFADDVQLKEQGEFCFMC